VVLHPLEETVVGENGQSERVLFYRDAEAVLAELPRRGIPMILHETRDKVEDGKPRPTRLYSASGMAKLVRRLRKLAKLPETFTLDACRHGGMTELEEAELTEGGRCPRTRVGPMRATLSGPWNGHSLRPGSATRIAWRTRREQTFRMTGRMAFRMTAAFNIATPNSAVFSIG
jgi:hypothetical protein